MKAGIHPDYHPVTVHCACGHTFKTRSTVKASSSAWKSVQTAILSSPANRSSWIPPDASSGSRGNTQTPRQRVKRQRTQKQPARSSRCFLFRIPVSFPRYGIALVLRTRVPLGQYPPVISARFSSPCRCKMLPRNVLSSESFRKWRHGTPRGNGRAARNAAKLFRASL